MTTPYPEWCPGSLSCLPLDVPPALLECHWCQAMRKVACFVSHFSNALAAILCVMLLQTSMRSIWAPFKTALCGIILAELRFSSVVLAPIPVAPVKTSGSQSWPPCGSPSSLHCILFEAMFNCTGCTLSFRKPKILLSCVEIMHERQVNGPLKLKAVPKLSHRNIAELDW